MRLILSGQVVAKKEITKVLNDWYQEMRIQHVIKARQLKKEIDSKINKIEEDQGILIYYSLLDFRYKMLIGDFKADLDESISEQQTDKFLNYYYHFFKFIYAMEIGNYSNAKKYYKLAEGLLAFVPDEAEKAEFNYRVALFHYYIGQPVLAVYYATKAEKVFSGHIGYEIKIGACKNTLGMACIELNQYELAEENLLAALNIFKKVNEHSLTIRVTHNIGLLYADQGLSELAIRHLTEAYDEYNPSKDDRTIYLLAREHFKLNNTQEVIQYIEEGLKYCNKEYEYHLSILKAKNESLPIAKLEKIVLPAIEYFKEQELWEYIQKYAEELAVKWFSTEDTVKSSKYFNMSYEAKIVLQKKGA